MSYLVNPFLKVFYVLNLQGGILYVKPRKADSLVRKPWSVSLLIISWYHQSFRVKSFDVGQLVSLSTERPQEAPCQSANNSPDGKS